MNAVSMRAMMGFGCAVLASCGGDSPAPHASAPDKLIVWQTESDQGAQAVLRQIESVMETKHPGLDVQIETVNWNSLSEKMIAAIQTGGLPDLAHIQPFMLTSLVSQDLLDPLDDVARQIQFQPDKTYSALMNAVQRNEHIYGIPYAVGTTFWAYRRDVFRDLGITPPQSWAELLVAVRKTHAAHESMVVLLPGASPFFIDQLFAELVANNNGRLFNPVTGDPELNSPAVRGVIRFFIDLKATGALDPDWASQTYQDQFLKFPEGIALLAPVTYARAAVAIESRAQELSKEQNKDVLAFAANQNVIGALDQPAGPLRKTAPIATIDCEPYVLFKAASRRNRGELAREFLREFFSAETYTRFVSQVPIHLTPIRSDWRANPVYNESRIVKNWNEWQEHTDRYLKGEDAGVRPILMPDPADTQLTFLFEFQNEKILSGAVQRALTETPTGSVTTDRLAAEIAQDAQCRTVALLKRIGSAVTASAKVGCGTP